MVVVKCTGGGDVDASGMPASEVLSVLAALEGAGCRAWVGGGWGVDALVGCQTRWHRDVDLAIDGVQEPAVLNTLSGLGYTVETDWRPVRVEMRARHDRRVDLHPVWFDESGNACRAGFAGCVFEDPRDCFFSWSIAGAGVPCLSRQQQLRFHAGYEPREAD